MGAVEPPRIDDGDSPRAAGELLLAAAEHEPQAIVSPVPGRRVLFLDDDPARAVVFLTDHPEAIWVQTAAECLRRLTEDWDEVHLDHDLGGQAHVDMAVEECGMEVIRWLCREFRPHVAQTLFVVHTHNFLAGLFMVLRMRERGYRAEFRPFGDDLARLLKHDGDQDEPAPLVVDPAPERPRGLWERLKGWLPGWACCG